MNSHTSLLIAKYPDDEDLINDWYSDLIADLDEDHKAFSTYLTKLISLLEAKHEDYEKCGVLLKIKKKIK